MNLLGAKLYDPAVAVSKATSALLAMTAFDTTNLRLAVTVPAHGMVRFRLRCAITGATTFPQVLLGVLNGATVVGRVAPTAVVGGTAIATTRITLDADFVVTGLTPGLTNFDAAYGVEVLLAATNIRYGGPNNTTTNDAWGAFIFEAWDPVSGSGLDAAGVRSALGLASANLDTQLNALPTNAELTTALSTADDTTLAAIAALNDLGQADIRTAVGLATANLDTQLGDLPTNLELTTALGGVGSSGGASVEDVTAAVNAAVLANLPSKVKIR